MSTNENVHVFAVITAQPDHADEVRAALTTLVAAVLQEPGNVHYVLHEDTKVPGSFHFFETYADQAAFDAHGKSPHIKSTFGVIGKLLAAKPAIVITKHITGD